MNYREIKKELAVKVDGGTFTLEGQAITFADGYQVSFENAVSNTVGDKAFDTMVERITEILGTQPNLGIWDGVAEISWHIESLQIAEHLARKFNQIAIWDWEEMKALMM